MFELGDPDKQEASSGGAARTSGWGHEGVLLRGCNNACRETWPSGSRPWRAWKVSRPTSSSTHPTATERGSDYSARPGRRSTPSSASARSRPHPWQLRTRATPSSPPAGCMAREFKTWARFGPPLGRTWEPTPRERAGQPAIRPLVGNDWTLLTAEAPSPSGAHAHVKPPSSWPVGDTEEGKESDVEADDGDDVRAEGILPAALASGRFCAARRPRPSGWPWRFRRLREAHLRPRAGDPAPRPRIRPLRPAEKDRLRLDLFSPRTAIYSWTAGWPAVAVTCRLRRDRGGPGRATSGTRSPRQVGPAAGTALARDSRRRGVP